MQVRQGVPVAEPVIDAHEDGAPDGGAAGGGAGQVRDLRPRPQLQVHLQQPHEDPCGIEGRPVHVLQRDVLHSAVNVTAPEKGACQRVGGSEEGEKLRESLQNRRAKTAKSLN